MCHSEGALSGAYRQLEGVVNDHVCIWTLYADIHGVMLLDQVLQQLNVCRISKKRKVKAQFEGKQARLEGRATAFEAHGTNGYNVVGRR